MKKSISFLLLLLNIVFTSKSTGQNISDRMLGVPFSKYISSTEYASGMLNSSITQDSRGFMYFANNFGLLEFDGNRWANYPVRDGSKVRSVIVSQGGRIYIGAQGDFGYFFPDSSGEMVYHSLSQNLPDENRNFDDVWEVFLIKEEIFFCTSNAIYSYENDSLKNIISINTSDNFFNLNGSVFFQGQEGGLYTIKSDSLIEEVIPKDRIPGKLIISLLSLPENKFIAVTSYDGIYNHMGLKSVIHANIIEKIQGLTINCAYRLRNGNLAFGTHDKGLLIFDDKGHQVLKMTKGRELENRSIYTMFEDLSGNLWLGHNNGVTMIELSIPFTYLSEDSDLPGSGYDAFRMGTELFVATNNGVFKRKLSDPNAMFTRVDNTEGQSYAIEEERGHLLLGHHTGSYEIERSSAKLLNQGAGTWTFLQSPLNPDIMISGTYNGLEIYNYVNSKWQYTSAVQGFDESSRVMEFDDRGNLWMTHGYKGVFRLRLNEEHDSILSTRFYGTESGLPSPALNNVFKVDNDLIFTTIEGPYIFNYESDVFEPVLELSEYPEMNQPLNFLAKDANSNIYFLTRDEIGVLKKQIDGTYNPEINKFNKIKPMLNDDLAGISIIDARNILFGAKEGFVVYNPNLETSKRKEYRTFIRSVEISGPSDSLIFAGSFTDNGVLRDNQIEGSSPVLTFNYNSIRFGYCANFINDFDQTVYRHKLEGFDENMSEWHSLNETSYTNLGKGDYTFRVVARNIYNNESMETSYSFTILAPWYESKVAYSIYFILFMSVILLIFREIDKRYKKSKLDFELTKQNEVNEISGKLNSLTQEKKEEIERLKSEKLQSEIDHKNAQLASSTMNLINKNIFITRIKTNLSSISKKSKSDEVKKELSRIRKEIDRNISYDEEWEQFTFHFNSIHGDFIQRLTKDYNNLSAQDLRLCSYLRLNLSTKEIAHLLNISVRGVEISRYRLRKKLMLSRNDNLAEFILNY